MRNIIILTAAATLGGVGQLIDGISGFVVKGGGDSLRRSNTHHTFRLTTNALPMMTMMTTSSSTTTATKRKNSFETTVVATTSQTTTTTTTTTPASVPSRSIRLPLRRPWTVETQQNLQTVLQQIVDSTAFFVNATTMTTTTTTSDLETSPSAARNWVWSCSVPAFGEDCRVQLQMDSEEVVSTLLHSQQPTASLVLSLLQQPGSDDSNSKHDDDDDDFGWICTKLYECSALLNDLVDCGAQLRDAVVVQHSNRPAASAAWNLTQTADFERILGGENNVRTVLRRLDQEGYVVIDHDNTGTVESSSSFPLVTTAEQQKQLSDYYLRDTSSQGPTIRTDRVHFLSRTQAAACHIEPQYDLLMGLANYLNDYCVALSLVSSSPHTQPVFPATLDQPLTVPRSLQFAEYGQGDYYIAHSDNALTDEFTIDNHPIRSNFRAYTCILYMNDNDWDTERDGGALVLYPHSQHFRCFKEAVAAGGGIPIGPINGRLLIFDSRLVHAVQTVTSSTKRRRALTLWINRPNNSGVRGEVYI